MARKISYDEDTVKTEKNQVPKPTIPSEPPILADSCENCKSKYNLKVFVIIEPEDDWFPPYRFDTFCTKNCAKEWNRPAIADDLPSKIVPYDRWPDRKQLSSKSETDDISPGQG